MKEKQQLEMQKNIDKLIQKKKFKDRFVIVFGSNEPAEEVICYLSTKHIHVNALLDNNKKKIGTSLLGIEIYSPEQLLNVYMQNAIILIASKYYYEMLGQLKELNYDENKHVFKVVELNESSNYSLSLKTFYKKYKRVRNGQTIYNELRKSHGQDLMFICPFQAIGDVYVVGAYFKEYLKRESIKDYCFIVVGKACHATAELFEIVNIKVLSQNEMDSLVQYVLMKGVGYCNVKLLHHRFPYTNRIGALGNYKNINFLDHYRYTIFNMEEGKRPDKPKVVDDRSYVYKLFEKNGLIGGKTVILSPYANTISNLPIEFWEELAAMLLRFGYSVCTNSSNESEPIIGGTVGVFFPIRYVINVVEHAGTVIGLRSGFCELIASADCRKIVIYPDRVYQWGKMVDFYSLKNMELCDDVEEIVYSDDDYKIIVDEVNRLLQI